MEESARAKTKVDLHITKFARRKRWALKSTPLGAESSNCVKILGGKVRLTMIAFFYAFAAAHRKLVWGKKGQMRLCSQMGYWDGDNPQLTFTVGSIEIDKSDIELPSMKSGRKVRDMKGKSPLTGEKSFDFSAFPLFGPFSVCPQRRKCARETKIVSQALPRVLPYRFSQKPW